MPGLGMIRAWPKESAFPCHDEKAVRLTSGPARMSAMSESRPAWLQGFIDAEERTYRADATLFRQGDPSRGAFLVLEGRARLLRRLRDGREVTLFVALPGTLIALPSLFSPAYHCEAQVETASRIATLPREALIDWLESDSARAFATIEMLSRETQRLRSLMTVAQIRPAHERVLAWLKLEASGDRVELERPLKQVATEIGLTHESLYRALARLEKEGAIERPRGKTFVLLGEA